MSNQVLFICTGNFYRSRFAEAFFNHHAALRDLEWKAFSRGLATHLVDGCGSISAHTVEALKGLKIDLGHTCLQPTQLAGEDLAKAGRIVALKEAEHRPLLEAQFPEWVDRVEYWHVHDLDFALPSQALREIQELVAALVEELHTVTSG
jgi:protein-tyrosine phosphatase